MISTRLTHLTHGFSSFHVFLDHLSWMSTIFKPFLTHVFPAGFPPCFPDEFCLSLLGRCRVEGAVLQLRHAGGVAVALRGSAVVDMDVP